MTDPQEPTDGTDGIPLLENPLPAEALPRPGLDGSDPQAMAELLRGPRAQQLLADMAQDLHQLVIGELERQLQQRLAPQIRQAAEQAAPQLVDVVLARLRSNLPELLRDLDQRAGARRD